MKPKYPLIEHCSSSTLCFRKLRGIKFGSISISNLKSLGLSINMGQEGLEQKKKMNVRIGTF